jgi:ABC-type multidrug transport system ATPase subunit
MLASQSRLVSVENLGLRFKDAQLLSEITLTVELGERFLLLGVSGSGKSLLIDAIAGNIPHSGSVEYSEALPKNRRAYSYDVFAMLSLLKGREVLRLVEAMYGAPRNERMIERFRLGELLAKPIRVFSKGERKRLGVYVALFSNPLLAMLDEPTDGMDPMLRDAFWEVVEERQGATFMTTHLWDEAETHHDRIALIAGGRLLAPPAPAKRLIERLGYAGKVVVPDLFMAEPGEAEFIHDRRRHIFFRDDAEKTRLVERATKGGAMGGYSVLPVDIRDAYVLLGGAMEKETQQ